MAKKSVVIGLPVVPFNHNKHADVIKYLEWLQTFFKEIVNNHNQADIGDQALSGHCVVCHLAVGLPYGQSQVFPHKLKALDGAEGLWGKRNI